MTRSFLVLLLGGALAACGEALETAEEETGPPATPSVAVSVVDEFPALGGRVVDMAIMPNVQPFFGRAFAALDSGGFAVIDLALGEISTLEGPRVGSIAAAPDFQLRGSPAPLLLAAGGAAGTPRAWVYLAADNELVEIPLDPIAPDAVVVGLCAERTTEALADILVLTEAAAQRWRISDRGGDTLAAERLEDAPSSADLAACASHNGRVVGVSAGGARVLGEAAWGFSDGTDVTSVEREDGAWAIVARPEERGATLIGPLTDEVDVNLDPGLNTSGMTAPALVAASAANLGGAYSSGALLAAQDDRVVVVELGGLVDDAKTALMGGS